MSKKMAITLCSILIFVTAPFGCGPTDTDSEPSEPEAGCCTDPDEPNVPQCTENPNPPPCSAPQVGPEPLPW